MKNCFTFLCTWLLCLSSGAPMLQAAQPVPTKTSVTAVKPSQAAQAKRRPKAAHKPQHRDSPQYGKWAAGAVLVVGTLAGGMYWGLRDNGPDELAPLRTYLNDPDAVPISGAILARRYEDLVQPEDDHEACRQDGTYERRLVTVLAQEKVDMGQPGFADLCDDCCLGGNPFGDKQAIFAAYLDAYCTLLYKLFEEEKALEIINALSRHTDGPLLSNLVYNYERFPDPETQAVDCLPSIEVLILHGADPNLGDRPAIELGGAKGITFRQPIDKNDVPGPWQVSFADDDDDF